MNTIALRISSVISASPRRLEMNLVMFRGVAGGRATLRRPAAVTMYALSR